MSLFNRLKDNFRVQSSGTQVLIIAIAIFIVEFLNLPLFTAILGVLISLAVSWLIAFLVIKFFDRNGSYSLHTIWRALLIGYLIYKLIVWLL